MSAASWICSDSAVSRTSEEVRPRWIHRPGGPIRSATAQVNAIMAREGLSALGGVIGLAIVFSSMTYVVTANAGDTDVLIALAATLPRQIDMTNQVHQLTSGWNDVLALWARVGGVARSMRPEPDPNFDRRIKDAFARRPDVRPGSVAANKRNYRMIWHLQCLTSGDLFPGRRRDVFVWHRRGI